MGALLAACPEQADASKGPVDVLRAVSMQMVGKLRGIVDHSKSKVEWGIAGCLP